MNTIINDSYIFETCPFCGKKIIGYLDNWITWIKLRGLTINPYKHSEEMFLCASMNQNIVFS